MAGKQIDSHPSGAEVVSTYADFVPIDVWLCSDCFLRARSKQARRRWWALLASLVVLPPLYYAMNELSKSSGADGVRDVLAVVVTVATLLPFVSVGGIVRARRNEGGQDETAAVLRPFAAAKTEAGGRTHFWKERDFEALRERRASR